MQNFLISNPISRLIARYFDHTKKYSNLRYILELTLVCFVGKIISVIFFGFIFSLFSYNPTPDTSTEQDLIKHGILGMILLVILFAGIETTISQWFTTWALSKILKNKVILIMLSALVFALLHLEPLLIVAVYPIGLVLTWTFLLKRQNSLWEAFYVTTSIHALHNLIVLVLFMTVG